MTDCITDLLVSAYEIPTDTPESDGTLTWDSTTLVLVEIKAADRTGIGYTYADSSAAAFIYKNLRSIVIGKDPFNISKIWANMQTAIRNECGCGLAYMSISAVDTALWDLKAKIMNMPLCQLIGKTRDEVQVYGSGGFTSYTDARLEEQLGEWADAGFPSVKMKIGRHPEKDLQRVKKARSAIGKHTELYVDANGAYNVKQAIVQADQFKEYDVTWFEEPVPSTDIEGLKFIRGRVAAGIKIAAGEYGNSLDSFLGMLRNGAVDVLQADATRCGGITGFLKTAHISEAFQIPFSFHCAPALHLHAALCTGTFYTGEFFYDHVRIEHLLFDGCPLPVKGILKPDMSRPGMGYDFKHKDAASYKAA